MRKYLFESVFGEDKISMSFTENNLGETLNKFFGFLRASGLDDEIIKTVTKDVIEGKWSNSLGAVSGSSIPLTASIFTPTTISTITSSTYNTMTGTT